VSKKGQLRVQAADYMLDADARGALRVSIGRAADFFGPDGRLSMFGDMFFERVLRGKSARVLGDPDLPRAYSYIPDVAAGLVTLGSHADARGVWMLPVQAAETTRQVVARFARALGRDVPIARVPTWVLRAAGVFQPMMREVAEMAYQWEQPYRVDDARFRAAFGALPTPWDEAIARTVAWAREAYPDPRAKPETEGDRAIA